jgi:hypothetical protein
VDGNPIGMSTATHAASGILATSAFKSAPTITRGAFSSASTTTTHPRRYQSTPATVTTPGIAPTTPPTPDRRSRQARSRPAVRDQRVDLVAQLELLDPAHPDRGRSPHRSEEIAGDRPVLSLSSEWLTARRTPCSKLSATRAQ